MSYFNDFCKTRDIWRVEPNITVHGGRGTEFFKTHKSGTLPGKEGRLESLDVYKYVMLFIIKFHHVPSSSISLIIHKKCKVKLPICLTTLGAVKAYGRMEVQTHSFET